MDGKMKSILSVVIMLLGMCYMVMEPACDVTDITYTVQTGDTVWNIAERYQACQIKPLNEFSWVISDRNQLAGKYIRPGDVLVIPLYTRAKR